MEFLHLLEQNSIPYSLHWDSSDQVPSGERSFRIAPNGDHIHKEFIKSETVNMINLEDLIQSRDGGLAAIGALIDQSTAKFHTIPWCLGTNKVRPKTLMFARIVNLRQ